MRRPIRSTSTSTSALVLLGIGILLLVHLSIDISLHAALKTTTTETATNPLISLASPPHHHDRKEKNATQAALLRNSFLSKYHLRQPHTKHNEATLQRNAAAASSTNAKTINTTLPHNPTAAICAIVKDEQLYLEEWVLYNLGIGFSHIYMYDNSPQQTTAKWRHDQSQTNTTEGKLIKDFTTVVPFLDESDTRQYTSYRECMQQYGKHHTWVAIIDVDEFIVFHNNNKNKNGDIRVFLMQHCKSGSLSLHWLVMGTSGHDTYEDLPVTMRFQHVVPKKDHDSFKSIVRVRDYKNITYNHHWVELTDNKLRHDTNGDWVELRQLWSDKSKFSSKRKQTGKKPFPVDVASIYHYKYKSTQEYKTKLCKRGDVLDLDLCAKLEKDVPPRGDVKKVYDEAFWLLLKHVPKYRSSLVKMRGYNKVGPSSFETGSFDDCFPTEDQSIAQQLLLKNVSSHHTHPHQKVMEVSCNSFFYRMPPVTSIGKVVIGVLSSAVGEGPSRRRAIRKTWARGGLSGRNNFVYFVVAGPWEDIQEEYDTHGDLIWLDRTEVYGGQHAVLTYKTLTFMKIVHDISMAFDNVQYAFKTDDDSFVNIKLLQDHLFQSKPDYWGICKYEKIQPYRNDKHKWGIPRVLYPEDYYPIYCQGAGFAMSVKFLACAASSEAGKNIANIRFMPFEDVAVGMLAERCGIVPVSTTDDGGQRLISQYRTDLGLERRTILGEKGEKFGKEKLSMPDMEGRIVQHRIYDGWDMIQHYEQLNDPEGFKKTTRFHWYVPKRTELARDLRDAI